MLDLNRPNHLQVQKAQTPEEILRSCITCGCCNEICPTFSLLNDENDGPRGRINLIRGMLESSGAPDAHTVKHLDRCLSCNACQTICPVDVDYMHLIDGARTHIEKTYRRPYIERRIRKMLADTLPYPDRFRSRMAMARRFGGIARAIAALFRAKPLSALLEAVPDRVPKKSEELQPGVWRAGGGRQGKVLIPSGCVQKVLDSDINRAAIALLNAAGVDVTVPDNDNCCGALVLHLGKEERALAQARRNIDAWHPLVEDGLDAIVITTSGCGTTIKDYGRLLADDPVYAERAAVIASLAKDVTEYLARIDLPEPKLKPDVTVAYHAACSLQHSQLVRHEPRRLLIDAGFRLTRPRDEHMCCGSAGTYSFLQPEIAADLRDRKAANLLEAKPDVIAGGNLGCLTHLAKAVDTPMAHTVQLLAWVYTGERPAALASVSGG